MKTALEVLTDARALISDPKHWAQGWFARDMLGGAVDARSPSAECFCALGALGRAMGRHFMDVTGHPAVEILRSVLPIQDISRFNDTHSHGEILDAFDRAIDAARKAVA
jgi:hypothetical protein